MLITKKIIIALIMLVCVVVSVIGGIAIIESSKIYRGVVVIDAGHGGIDGGVTHGDMIESKITLELSKLLEKKLIGLGYEVVQTRKTENALAQGKSADMAERAKIINNANPEIVLSLHINKFSDTSRRGVQVFYDDTKRSQEVGVKMQSVLNTYINAKFCGRDNLDSLGGDYYITKCTRYPSVIVECGFISNAQDRALLKDSKFKNALIDTIATSLLNMSGDASS